MRNSTFTLIFWNLVFIVTMYISSNEEYLRAIVFALVGVSISIVYAARYIAEAIEESK